MKQIAIGNSNWHASAIILGIMRMGELSITDAIDVLTTARDSGINMIDSADIYGGGNAEIVLGKALKEGNFNRDDFYIQSKAGIDKGTGIEKGYGKRFNFRKDYLIKSVDDILQRTQLDYLDSFLLHRPDALMDVYEVAEAFDYLHHSGKVRYFGVSNFSDNQVNWLQANLNQRLMINQLQFGLMHTKLLDHGFFFNAHGDAAVNISGGTLEYAMLNQMTIQAWSPFQHGMIEGVFIDNPDYPEVNRKLAEFAEKYGVEKNAIAAAWIMKHPAHMQVVSGSMTPARIKSIAQGSEIELSDLDWYDLYAATGKQLP